MCPPFRTGCALLCLSKPRWACRLPVAMARAPLRTASSSAILDTCGPFSRCALISPSLSRSGPRFFSLSCRVRVDVGIGAFACGAFDSLHMLSDFVGPSPLEVLAVGANSVICIVSSWFAFRLSGGSRSVSYSMRIEIRLPAYVVLRQSISACSFPSSFSSNSLCLE